MEFTYTLTEECKKFLGYSPYDNDSNVCRGDAVYLNSLYKKYGKTLVEATLQFCRQQFDLNK
jgi:hypothetical protein